MKRLVSNSLHVMALFKGFVVAVMLLCVLPVTAQKSHPEGLSLVREHNNLLQFEYGIGELVFTPVEQGTVILHATGSNTHSMEAGKPMLPQYSHIIAIPADSDPTVTIENEVWEEHTLREWDIEGQLCMTPQYQLKSMSPSAYLPCESDDTLYRLPLVQITQIGEMRGMKIMRITISPIAYDPSGHRLSICSHLGATINYNSSKPNDDLTTRQLLQSDALTVFLTPKAAHSRKDYTNQIVAETRPYSYVVVAPSQYRRGLQPLISWKRQEGYIVEEIYTDSHDCNSIKDSLQRLYDNATFLRPAPFFILLVGDADVIPPFTAQHRISGLGSHRTDLYYAEFTGDYLPDALVGRLPINDTVQLHDIVDKTLAYEKYLLPDSSYLSRSLLVAGAETRPPAPVVTNGQVNYLKEYLVQHDPGHDTICFYNPSSDTLGEQIFGNLRQGVGLVSYTAHCSSWGWQHPSLTNGQIDTLAEDSHLFIAINNCCKANDFIGDCFGEHLIRKASGGAVGAIGATNETLWEEDYYWGVGNREVLSEQPLYNPSQSGAYDRLFHTHGETPIQRAQTLSQMIVAGNFAVSRSGSPYDAFYWEIYCLLGDPSLMPYIGIPASLHLQADNVNVGDMAITLHGTPYARVAATHSDTLLGVCTLDSSGNGVMSTVCLLYDSILLTATAQYHKPLQTTIVPQPVPGARIAIVRHDITEGGQVSQLECCDTAVITLILRNLGDSTAYLHTLHLWQDNDDTDRGASAQIWPAETTIFSLPPHQDTSVQIIVATLPTESSRMLSLHTATGSDSILWSGEMVFDILRPDVVIDDITLLHDGTATTSLMPSSTYTLRTTLRNKGLGTAQNLIAEINSSNTYLGHLYADSIVHIYHDITTPDSISLLSVHVSAMHCADTMAKDYCFVAGNAVETFENGDFTHFPWTTENTTPWYIDSTTAHNGSYSTHSGIAIAESPSDLSILLKVNNTDSVSFWFKTSCRNGIDQLTFNVDGTRYATWSGEQQWQRYTCLLQPGKHTLLWRYSSNDTLGSEDYAAWVDDIRLPFSLYDGDHAGYDIVTVTEGITTPSQQTTLCRIYPNPASGMVTFESFAEPTTIIIYDCYGRKVEEIITPSDGKTQYSTHRLRCGIYSVLFCGSHHRETQKMLIIR